MKSRDQGKPFFLYVSHKAVHADFVPADRHRGRYDDKPLPISVPSDEQLEQGNLPMWVRNQRNSRHGADFGYNLPGFDPAVYYRRYCESLLAVDDGVGRLMEQLDQMSLRENTIVVYMGDNGFQFGDHGLIDKRTAYEASARVPLIVSAPGKVPAGQSFKPLIANIDVAPTLLDAAGAKPLDTVDGISLWGALCGQQPPKPQGWPNRVVLYEYYWERNYPHTPTIHAILGAPYKYIRCHGLWDQDELYDLQADPNELKNLINDPQHADRVEELNQQLWEMLADSEGMEVPLLEDRGPRFPWRHPEETDQAKFPPHYIREREPPRQP